jgi:heparanase 1
MLSLSQTKFGQTSMQPAPDRMIQSGRLAHRSSVGGVFRAFNPVAVWFFGCLTSAMLVASAHAGAVSTPVIASADMRRIATVDQRFQSYNIEMVEITGGRFWKPYRVEPGGAPAQPPRSGSDTPPGMDSHLYQYRPPIDLTNAQLRNLAAALGPAYVRVSGTWANTTYFADESKCF